MTERDRTADELRAAVDRIARDRAPTLLKEARAEAEARIRALLVEELEEALLEHARRASREGMHSQARRPRPGARRERAGPAERKRVPDTSTRGRGDRDERAEHGHYVYGVAAAGAARLPGDLGGVDSSHPVTLVEHRGLAAIASRVSLSEFGEEPLHENLNDVQWLEEKARAHERVLDEVLRQIPVVPMRLCTIYRGEAQVREMLEREHDVFIDALARLEGKTEWGVKLIAEAGALDRAADSAPGSDHDSEAELSAGAAYMREKSRAARRRDRADRIAEAWAQDVHDRVAAHAVEALLNPLQNPEVSGHVGDMLLNGVYLVDDRASDEFHAAVHRLAAEYEPRGARVELTGPWPPYNFVKGSIEAAR